MNNRLKGFLLIIAGTSFWGASGVVVQYLLHDKMFNAQWLTCIRLTGAGIILLVMDKVCYRSRLLSIWNRSSAKDIIAFSMLGMLGTQLTYILTILNSNAATATILQYLMPAFVLVYMLAAEKRGPMVKEGICLFMAISGTFLLVTKGQLNTLAISLPALIWGLISALAAAFYTLQPRKMLRCYHSSLIVGWGMFTGGVILSLFKSPFDFTGTLDLYSIVALLFVVIFGTVLSFWTYIESTKYLYPTEVGAMASIEPLVSVVLSVVFMNVAFGIPEICGSILIVGTVFVLAKK
ncbi:DMT family transporter [Pectinatus sottacetonis]|uniref:DMT family transporter n=1 Tax=Pectinatus sottacetonis TaxID=1002795 RepID=UPI0018C4718B|nr:DMT family transporter [Pectinatus sottacetonis]